MLVTTQFRVPLTYNIELNYTMQVSETLNYLVTNIHYNIFFYVPQKESRTGVNDDRMIIFGWTIALAKIQMKTENIKTKTCSKS